MVIDRRGRTAPWTPTGFERYREHFPATEWDPVPPALDRHEAFETAWADRRASPRTLAVVLTPGLFAEWLPGCFRATERHLATLERRCLRTPVATRHDSPTQARRLGTRVSAWLRADERFVWCTHSKGGLDALLALERDAELRARCAALVLVQLPVGFSWVVEDIRAPDRPWTDRLLASASRSRWFSSGVDEISRARPRSLARWSVDVHPRVPTLQAVSWSVSPTHRMDTWHARLARLRPGHAHDGQFFLADQRLDGIPLVGLPALDHAQPVLGGGGLDAGRLWAALAAVACRERVPR